MSDARCPPPPHPSPLRSCSYFLCPCFLRSRVRTTEALWGREEGGSREPLAQACAGQRKVVWKGAELVCVFHREREQRERVRERALPDTAASGSALSRRCGGCVRLSGRRLTVAGGCRS
eukprot:1749696-Rhodomonas_salina.3